MHTNLIAVGNSKGLRLPKALLAQCGIEDRVVLRMLPDGLLISPVRPTRQDWEERIKEECASATDEEVQARAKADNNFDQDEWTCPTLNR